MLPTALIFYGWVLAELRDHEASLAAFRRSREIGETRWGQQDERTLMAQIGVGQCLVNLGRPEGAIELLEPALVLSDGLDKPEPNRAAASFALARALWDSNRDRPRAKKLAAAALKLYEGLERSQREHKRVRAWIRAHG